MKRKGGSYLGGHTVITLHPSTVKAGLVEQAAEHRRQAHDDQQKFDYQRIERTREIERIEYQSHGPERHAQQNAETYYREQLRQIERALHLKPHPKIALQLLSRELVLLDKLLSVVPDKAFIKRRITTRIQFTQWKLKKYRGM